MAENTDHQGHLKSLAEQQQILASEIESKQRLLLKVTGASTTDIVAKKQALRDAPADSSIDVAINESQLKSQWNTSILGTSPYS